MPEITPEDIVVGESHSLSQLHGSRWRKWGQTEAEPCLIVVGVTGEGRGAEIRLDRAPGGHSFTLSLAQLVIEYLPYFSQSGNAID